MAAFLGISIWITLAMVIPGLVTLAVVVCAFLLMSTCGAGYSLAAVTALGEWVIAGIVMWIMVMNQAIGILLEAYLVRCRWLGRPSRVIAIPPGIDPLGNTTFVLHPYEEYQVMYLLLAELREHEDEHGHLQRSLAQFFLTNNVMVSFSLGIVTTIILYFNGRACDWHGPSLYGLVLLVCLVISFQVAKIRFEVMSKALWAARRHRLARANLAP